MGDSNAHKANCKRWFVESQFLATFRTVFRAPQADTAAILTNLRHQMATENNNKRNEVVDKFLKDLDFTPSNLPEWVSKAIYVILEDNEAVIKLINKLRWPSLKYVPRTQRVDLDFIIERINSDPGIFVKYIGTLHQIADIFTKGMFTAAQFQNLTRMCMIGKIRPIIQKQENENKNIPKHNICVSLMPVHSNFGSQGSPTSSSCCSRAPLIAKNMAQQNALYFKEDYENLEEAEASAIERISYTDTSLALQIEAVKRHENLFVTFKRIFNDCAVFTFRNDIQHSDWFRTLPDVAISLKTLVKESYDICQPQNLEVMCEAIERGSSNHLPYFVSVIEMKFDAMRGSDSINNLKGPATGEYSCKWTDTMPNDETYKGYWSNRHQDWFNSIEMEVKDGEWVYSAKGKMGLQKLVEKMLKKYIEEMSKRPQPRPDLPDGAEAPSRKYDRVMFLFEWCCNEIYQHWLKIVKERNECINTGGAQWRIDELGDQAEAAGMKAIETIEQICQTLSEMKLSLAAGIGRVENWKSSEADEYCGFLMDYCYKTFGSMGMFMYNGYKLYEYMEPVLNKRGDPAGDTWHRGRQTINKSTKNNVEDALIRVAWDVKQGQASFPLPPPKPLERTPELRRALRGELVEARHQYVREFETEFPDLPPYEVEMTAPEGLEDPSVQEHNQMKNDFVDSIIESGREVDPNEHWIEVVSRYNKKREDRGKTDRMDPKERPELFVESLRSRSSTVSQLPPTPTHGQAPATPKAKPKAKGFAISATQIINLEGPEGPKQVKKTPSQLHGSWVAGMCGVCSGTIYKGEEYTTLDASQAGTPMMVHKRCMHQTEQIHQGASVATGASSSSSGMVAQGELPSTPKELRAPDTPVELAAPKEETATTQRSSASVQPVSPPPTKAAPKVEPKPTAVRAALPKPPSVPPQQQPNATPAEAEASANQPVDESRILDLISDEWYRRAAAPETLKECYEEDWFRLSDQKKEMQILRASHKAGFKIPVSCDLCVKTCDHPETTDADAIDAATPKVVDWDYAERQVANPEQVD